MCFVRLLKYSFVGGVHYQVFPLRYMIRRDIYCSGLLSVHLFLFFFVFSVFVYTMSCVLTFSLGLRGLPWPGDADLGSQHFSHRPSRSFHRDPGRRRHPYRRRVR